MASLVSTIEQALAGIASAMPDAVRAMTHGAETGNAIKSSSVDLGGEDASDSGAVEKSRVIVTASDFPTLVSDSLVSISSGSDELARQHIVTSLKTDPIGASMTVGLSDPLSETAASVTGVRGSRSVRFPIGLLAVNNGLSTDIAEGFAPTSVYSWTLVVAMDEWPEIAPPYIGDTFTFDKDGETVTVKVARCDHRDRHFILAARSR